MNPEFTRYQELPSLDALLVATDLAGRDPRGPGVFGTARAVPPARATAGGTFASPNATRTAQRAVPTRAQRFKATNLIFPRMNPDAPRMPREEMETWLTSLLLGELSEGEAAAVRELIKHNPELAKLHGDLKSTIHLVREATVKSIEPTPAVQEQAKLSADRREKLLAQFKTVIPKELTPQKRRPQRRLLELAAVLVILGLLSLVALPNFVKSRHTARVNSVLNNLRQLDGYKALSRWPRRNAKSRKRNLCVGQSRRAAFSRSRGGGRKENLRTF